MSVEKNRISVKATINDTDTVTFMFDTGASVGALLPDSLAKRYKDMRQLKIALANGEKHNNIDSTKIAVDFITQNVDNNLLLLGIINRNNHRYWSINYDDLILQILPKENVIDTTDALVFDFEMAMNSICLTIPMKMYRAGKAISHNFKFMLDTGCPFAFVVTDPSSVLQKFVESIGHFDMQRLQPNGRQDIKDSRFFVLDSISFSGHTIKNLHSTFSYEMSFDKYLKNGTVGLLGMEILKHFNTVIDFEKKRIILKAHNKTFDYEMVTFMNALGFQIRDNDKTVISIERGHNAQKAGIKLGDKILRINELDSANLTPDIFDSLRLLKGENKMISNRSKLYGNMNKIFYLRVHVRTNKEIRTQPRSSPIIGSWISYGSNALLSYALHGCTP